MAGLEAAQQAHRDRLGDRGLDAGMALTKERGPEGRLQVDEAPAVDVGQPGALARSDVHRPADRAVDPRRGRDAARQMSFGALEERVGGGCLGGPERVSSRWLLRGVCRWRRREP